MADADPSPALTPFPQKKRVGGRVREPAPIPECTKGCAHKLSEEFYKCYRCGSVDYDDIFYMFTLRVTVCPDCGRYHIVCPVRHLDVNHAADLTTTVVSPKAVFNYEARVAKTGYRPRAKQASYEGFLQACRKEEELKESERSETAAKAAEEAQEHTNSHG